MSVSVKETGDLKSKSVFMLLIDGLKRRESGVYIFAQSKEKISLIVKDGKLKTPLAMLGEAQLGKHLAQSGVVDGDTFMKILALSKEQSIPLFQAAIQSQSVTDQDVQTYIENQFDEMFSKLFSWTQGKYAVVEQVPKDVAPLEIKETFASYVFTKRLEYHLQAKTNAPSGSLQPVETPQIAIEEIEFTPEQERVLTELKKNSSLKGISTSDSMTEEGLNAFVSTLMDFGFWSIPKAKAEATATDPLDSYNYKHVYENFDELNLYEILGVAENASVADISKQYMSIAKKYHPDRFREEGFEKTLVEKVFSKVSEAFQTLKNPQTRQDYDDKLSGNVEEDLDVEKVMESEGLFLDGMDATRRGQFDKAMELFAQAIELYNEEPEYHLRLGWAQYRYGQKTDNATLQKQGKQAIEEALKGDRVLDDVNYYHGLILKNDGDYKKALVYFNRALKENKNHVQAGQELRAIQMLIEKRGTNKKKGWFK